MVELAEEGQALLVSRGVCSFAEKALTAQAAGYAKVYWFRGGLPEWEASGLPVAHD